MPEHTVIVIEDDEAIGNGLVTALQGQGYATVWCRTGAEGLDAVTTGPVDLVLLDLGLPDVDGIEVCRQVRVERPEVVVVMLTARAQEFEVVAGLDAGADDYITKPFRLAELHARLRAHLRRPAPSPAETDPSGPVRLGSVVVDLDSRRVSVAGAEVDLRAKEFDLLAMLVTNVGRALSRDQIMTEVWDEHWYGSTKTLDMHISALRRKLGDPPPVTITTLRGVGYRLEAP